MSEEEEETPVVIEPRVTKVKIGKIASGSPRTTVKWLRPAQDEADEIDFSSSAERHADFDAAMFAIVPHAVRMLGLREEYGVDMRAIGLTLTEKEGNRGATVTLRKDLSCGVLILNTPHLPEIPYDPDGVGASLPKDLAACVWVAAEEALLYAQGRKRHDLFSTSGVTVEELVPA